MSDHVDVCAPGSATRRNCSNPATGYVDYGLGVQTGDFSCCMHRAALCCTLAAATAAAAFWCACTAMLTVSHSHLAGSVAPDFSLHTVADPTAVMSLRALLTKRPGQSAVLVQFGAYT